MKGAELPDGDEDGDGDADDGRSPATYDDDGGNNAHNPRSAVIGRRESDEERTGRPASATRTFGLGGRKAKVAARIQKFLTMCPAASDDEALGYALSRRRVRKGSRPGSRQAEGSARPRTSTSVARRTGTAGGAAHALARAAAVRASTRVPASS